MGKIWVEVCLISARGLRRSSSLWKLQWFAVGWVDPNNRYCTKIDASGNANPTWNTKFATLVEDSSFQDMALHVEVYSREPIFLRERLQGSATIVLKEFLASYSKSSDTGKEVGSYQLRKRNSGKPQGLINVSIRISEDRGDPTSFAAGNEGEFVLMGHNNNIASSSEEGFQQTFRPELPLAPPRQPTNFIRAHSNPYPTNNSNDPPKGGSSYPIPSIGPSHHLPGAAVPSYYPPRTPPPPPPPSNVGYVPAFLPSTNYVNMPSSATSAPGRGVRPALVGVGAGALAAGAVIFGDDFMSGFDVPASLPDDPTLAISIDPPF